MAEHSTPDVWPKRVIIEYVGAPDERIFGFGFLAENGEVKADEEETFGSMPAGECPVMKANGTLVSNEDYRAALESSD